MSSSTSMTDGDSMKIVLRYGFQLKNDCTNMTEP
jgi:hypothetical protein